MPRVKPRGAAVENAVPLQAAASASHFLVNQRFMNLKAPN